MSVEIELSHEGPPPGVSRRGRWADAHFAVQAADPGVWVVFKNLDGKDASSLRTSMGAKAEQVVARHQEDNTVQVWVLREAGSDNSQDGSITPRPVQASTGLQ